MEGASESEIAQELRPRWLQGRASPRPGAQRRLVRSELRYEGEIDLEPLGPARLPPQASSLSRRRRARGGPPAVPPALRRLRPGYSADRRPQRRARDGLVAHAHSDGLVAGRARALRRRATKWSPLTARCRRRFDRTRPRGRAHRRRPGLLLLRADDRACRRHGRVSACALRGCARDGAVL